MNSTRFPVLLERLRRWGAWLLAIAWFGLAWSLNLPDLSWSSPVWAAASGQNEIPLSPSGEPTPEAIAPNRLGPDPSSIPSEKISQFIGACLRVVALIDKREGQLQGAETETESARIEQEIETDAIAIIEQAGLTRQEYLQLLGLANTDPEFGERIAIQLQEAVN